ncbi:Arsenical pump membrane protein [Rhodopseudomonas palustris]|uniref:Arsenical pump membrane protein n=1 Tax=Rhodopseudomonas palustris (strain ATCC BAA-98 / CGA009) TaxID=258594 RepID=Q6N7J9_RHOPA|nr:arsenic transporter [Rhodopseudomonas palustris]OPF90468.1 arsenical efflux pump membrane protein ArsB [Rhodopseudomonas palustris]QQM03779.1 Arsenical pump membrane protein [Rhodopseudomonas palustris]RJF61850.1 arsenical efflux pump membrane protein ArsB [Rhodopseudomonas palustris]WAB79918.1 arsenic transporter [Rhodopseudomonas palustris]WCL92421.1 arsenic transporter [Rhodopseudomonas palustris CGA009]
MLIALAIFVATIALVIWQPKGLGIGWSALGGAAIALLVGVVSLSDVPVVWGIVWNATATFVAIIIVSLLLDEAGFFEWAALHVARWGGGHGRRLFVLIVLLGAAVSALFANDGAALILTPIVIAMLRALGYKDKATLAFVMAAGFIADTASLPLIVSNLVNIVSADFFRIGFADYASVMVPVDLASIAATLVVLLLFFRRDIPASYDVAQLRAPADAIRDPATFKAGWVVLALLLAGFFLLEPIGVPVSAVAAAGAVLLLIIAARGHVIQTRKVLAGAPWQVVIFSLGMYLVVYGLRNAGLTDHLAGLLDHTAQGGVWGAAFGTGTIAALLSSVMNNMPTVLVGALSIDATHATGAIKEAMIYANVIGCDLGPKITPIGSLATLLWLHVLGQKGIRIGWGYYFKVGATLTIPVLLVTLAALAIRLSL